MFSQKYHLSMLSYCQVPIYPDFWFVSLLKVSWPLIGHHLYYPKRSGRSTTNDFMELYAKNELWLSTVAVFCLFISSSSPFKSSRPITISSGFLPRYLSTSLWLGNSSLYVFQLLSCPYFPSSTLKWNSLKFSIQFSGTTLIFWT